MSFLNNTRLVFSGSFQADVSTVNNDVRHFSNDKWEPRFQDFQRPDGTEDGWWNPNGTGAFRLVGCRITGVHYGDGTSATSPAQDPAVGLAIAGANNRVAAKLVDLDPQWQQASEIWGLDVRLSAGKEPPLVQGRFGPSAFRDLTFTRMPSEQADRAASATFQSVMDEVAWSAAAADSRALRELRQLAASGSLSIRLMTFGFSDTYGEAGFTLGAVCGAIGPHLVDEPRTFVLGRRFVAADQSIGTSWNGINYFTGAIDEGSSTLSLDLSNALQVADRSGASLDIGRLTVGILRDASLAEKAPVTPANFEELGEIGYKAKNWLLDTSGIFSLRLNAAQLTRALAAPLALAAEKPPGTRLVAIRENADGLMSCAEAIAQRIDSPGKGSSVIHAAQYGRPLPGAKLSLTLQPPLQDVGGGDPSAPNQPAAPYPVMGIPQDAIAFPASITADQKGRASVDISVKALDRPRTYLDGQIFLVGYQIDGEPPNGHPQFDFIAVHARDAYTAPAEPAWIPDIAPIFTQYGNLYPIMSQRLVDLTDPESVEQNLKILQLAFSLDIGDPNYMPVTRDLSAGKRSAIQRWLQRLATKGDPTFRGGPRPPNQIAAGGEAVAARLAAARSPRTGGKTAFAQSFRRSRGRPDRT
jgi:hypothetical protein